MRTWSRGRNSGSLTLPLLLWCLCTAAENTEHPSTKQGSAPDKSEQQEESTKTQRHETTVPLLLKGIERRPLSQLRPGIYPASLQLVVHAEGEELILMLEKNEGLFASHYTETHYREDGSAVTGAHNFTMNCYYHGEVQEHPGSDVTLSVCSGLRGFIALENKTFIIEPVSGRHTGAHFIYRVEELKLATGACGHGFNLSSVAPENHIRSPFQSFHTRHKRHIQKTTKYVELIIVADNREFQKQGKDLEKVKQRLAEIANYVDKFYRALNIRVALVGLEVWSDSDKCPITQDPFTTLHEFLDWRKVKLLPQKPHDNAQLISGVYFQGTTIGMAPIMSMCTVEQSGGIVMDHSENPLGAAVTLAHELGHNFGMNHDTPERGCGCRMTVDRGGCIMTPSTGSSFTSRMDQKNARETGLMDGEPGNQKLKSTRKPKLKLAGTLCRESSNSCDLPEFCTGASPHCPANVYLHDGHACHKVEGYCYNGICQTHEQQCITLWGQGAKPAPGICFKRVNSAGDPYGNCGKDSKGSFAKCDARDAKCGKIQCQGGANRPVIGTNAVSIETNIPLQEGGRILCRGTHVYLGDDMPDPGLVLAGTKCGENMVCLNRQCQNVSVFGVLECSGKCNGRGVCNNKMNCHCEAHWAPPFCEKAGFGGSIDSGPMRLADVRVCVLMCVLSYMASADSVIITVAILVTLVSLLVATVVICLKRKTLLRLFISNKKSTLEKLRSLEESRPTSPIRTESRYRPTPRRKPPPKPSTANIYKPSLLSAEPLLPPHSFHSHSLRRLPLYQPLHISHPMPVSLSVGQPTLPPLPFDHRVLPTHTSLSPPLVPPFLSLPRKQSSYRTDQDFEKPSPPQKPLPADPLGRSSRLGHCASAGGVHIAGAGALPVPIPKVPRPPPSIHLPNRPVPALPYRPPKTPRDC
ncbi:disintegrin and metalloproteinase domain-containing protein 12 [Nematolebias whitei]|uniref:disintegrin and metalloproteinase domain-containing protein 12 n=1 Tax=Nematolebias whitei TaxID=451745 RepID=UPI0018980ADD|nr:disintegrin and metalloproteinase domain-containing protein 12 [Nematolebias whitei]